MLSMIRQLARSSAFRLILSYMLFFGASVAVLLVFIYFATSREMERQIKHVVNIQLADLGRKFVLDGEAETVAQIRHLMQNDRDQTSIFLLIDPNWNVVVGNIEQWPGGSTSKKDWVEFSLFTDDPEKAAPRALAINTTLPGGYILLVGQKLQNKEKIEQIIVSVLQISMGLTILLAVIGGTITYLTIRRRLEWLNQTCRKVMAGDLTQRVAVSGSGDEFDHLAENFNAMLTRINELIEGIRDISNNVAHDLRTPLNHLRNRLENLVRRAASEDDTRNQIKTAIGEIDGLVATFNAILRISQAEAGAGFEQFAPVNLSEIMLSVMELYEAWAEEKNIRLELHITQHVITHGEKHLLTQAFANLIDNAIKYTPESGTIRIDLNQNRHNWVATIADSGPGIPEAYFKRVTEKFFRLERSRSTPGSGLGLSLANAVFRLHGADMIFSDNKPGLKVEIIFRRTT